MQRLAIAVLAITLVWGCKDDGETTRKGDSGANSGGSGGSGDSGGSSAVPGDTRLGELTEAQGLDLCEELRSTANSEDAQRGTCVIAASIAVDAASGGTADEVLEACGDQLDACLAAAPKPCAPIAFTADCDATVADFIDCSSIAARQLSALAERSCDDIIASSGASPGDGGVTSDLEAELEACSARLNACSLSSSDAG